MRMSLTLTRLTVWPATLTGIRMDEPTPTEAELETGRDEMLRRVAAFAASHGLRDASLIRQFDAYLQDAQTHFDLSIDRSLAELDERNHG